MSEFNTPFFDKNESDHRYYSATQGKQLENTVANIADGTGGKSYPDIDTAMSVFPVPNDNVMFSIDENNVEQSGVYAYDSSKVSGYRFVRGFANGEVETGDMLPVSGDSTRKAIDAEVLKVLDVKLEVGALDLNTGNPVNSSTRARSVDFQNVTGKIKLISPNLFISNIVYYNNGVWAARVNLGFVTEYDIAYPAGANQFKIVLSKNPNTVVIGQVDVDNSKLELHVPEKYDFKAIDTFKPIRSDYDNAEVDINTSANELGGIVNSTGANSDNNIRIRSKDKVGVNDGHPCEISEIPAGYVLSRIFRYLNGVFVSNTQYPPKTFTPNSTFNQIRLVWEKTNNAEVITPAEVEAFSCKILQKTDKLTAIAVQSRKVPIIERRLTAVENSNISPWIGLTMVVIGDSISFGFIPRNYPGFPGQLNSYAKLAADKLGMLFYNNGISGSTVGQLVSNPTANAPFVLRTNDLNPNAHLILVKGGTNDLRKISVLGSMSDRSAFTYYGALHVLFQDLLNRYVYNDLSHPKTIVAITPIKIYPNETWGTGNWTIKDYRDAMIEVANYYAIPVFDAWALSGMTPSDFRTLQGTTPGYTDMYNPLITDGVHPTQEGHEIFAEALVGFLKTLK